MKNSVEEFNAKMSKYVILNSRKFSHIQFSCFCTLAYFSLDEDLLTRKEDNFQILLNRIKKRKPIKGFCFQVDEINDATGDALNRLSIH